MKKDQKSYFAPNFYLHTMPIYILKLRKAFIRAYIQSWDMKIYSVYIISIMFWVTDKKLTVEIGYLQNAFYFLFSSQLVLGYISG